MLPMFVPFALPYVCVSVRFCVHEVDLFFLLVVVDCVYVIAFTPQHHSQTAKLVNGAAARE